MEMRRTNMQNDKQKRHTSNKTHRTETPIKAPKLQQRNQMSMVRKNIQCDEFHTKHLQIQNQQQTWPIGKMPNRTNQQSRNQHNMGRNTELQQTHGKERTNRIRSKSNTRTPEKRKGNQIETTQEQDTHKEKQTPKTTTNRTLETSGKTKNAKKYPQQTKNKENRKKRKNNTKNNGENQHKKLAQQKRKQTPPL